MLINWFRSLFGLGPYQSVETEIDAPEVETDPWAGSFGFYVTDFRTQIENIAKGLGVNFHTRFNHDNKCIELFTERGVVAKVYAHGDESGVTSLLEVSTNLPPENNKLFLSLFSKVEIGPLKK